MRVKRKINSEIIDLTEPHYTQNEGVNGYLVTTGIKVYFVYYSDSIQYADVSHRFEILKSSK